MLKIVSRKRLVTDGYIFPKYLEDDWDKKEQEMIWSDELELDDRREIISLIFQVKSLAKEKEERWKRDREEKFASNSNLFEWGKLGGCIREFADLSGTIRKYYLLSRKENNKVFNVNIPKNHPALNNFYAGNQGFYLISGVDKLPYEPSPYNYYITRKFFSKWVSLNDKIMLIPISYS